jgi:hypothetical protein
MFTLAKAQFDLTIAWSELVLSTFAASTMMANSGAKVMAASAALEQALQQPLAGIPNTVKPWPMDLPSAGLPDPARFADAWTQASTAFWTALLQPAKPATKPLPLWWTVFTDPVLPAKPAAGPALRPYLLH